MVGSIDGIYAAFMTGTAGQGLAMVVMRKGKVVGVDVTGTKLDGNYSGTESGVALNLNIMFPPNTPSIQGGVSGPAGERSELTIELPPDFLTVPFFRVSTNLGPVNIRLVKLRELDD